MYEGSIDRLTTTHASGWIYGREAGRAAHVVAVLHGRIIGEARAALYRPDIEKAGLGDGFCGFDLPFSEPVRDGELHFVTVQPRGSNLSIPRTSDDTYRDLVGALTRRYPGAGRSRTVLGGLWTDRTDALQILAGRLGTGACPAGAMPDLRRLIADGFVALRLPEGAGLQRSALDALLDRGERDGDASRDAAAQVARVVVTEGLAALLKAAFDDVPVAYAFQLVPEGEGRFAQAAAFEAFTSPAESVAVYVPMAGTPGRLDHVLDSHEFPEFGRDGTSRWTGEGTPALPMIAAAQERPVESHDLGPDRMTVVGPGLIHRVLPSEPGAVLRIVFAPKRNTPVRFLTSEEAWREIDLGRRVRARIG